ncbi:helix-turn-helix domain-containing protein [Methylophilus sp. VKM B-3414]|uniref:helix-turn-helix domain-containing protein n=1 Tax=Methylophilus sp. VKM B-3414 TaxID=3076121 RepID=UPI0028C67517|nr:helix-turn-helix domain-containing protein [Methylophilus sp. VKM B-3414]MDT7849402.1 helix-turn-helix domain-containing protein [Methylophilus sp. VKM B-3414]
MLNAKEAAAILSVSIRYLYSLAQSGAIPHYRIGKRTLRFEEAQILEYKESCAVAVRVPKQTAVVNVKISLPEEKSELQLFFEEFKRERKNKRKR